MRRKMIPILVLLVFVSLTAGPQAPIKAQESKTLAFDHVTVIDATGRPAQPDMTVVISGDRISALAKSGKIRIPEGTTVIDATGKFLIPGLWDMHTHAFMSQEDVDFMLPQFVASGVVGIRDMHGNLDAAKRAIAEFQSGKRIGPRIYFAGPMIDGPKPVSPTFPSAKTVEEARRMVQWRKAGGVDFIKVYSRLTRDQYFAIVDEAKKQGLPFAGHVPVSITAAEASDAGQKAFEHLMGVEMGVSSREDDLRQKQAAGENFEFPDGSVLRQTYSKPKADELFARFVKNGTWQVPTLVVIKALATQFSEPIPATDPRLKFLPAYVKEFWGMKFPNFDETKFKDLYAFDSDLVGNLHRAGVKILAGSDTPNPKVFPGSSLHEEMGLLVKAGLTPMEALQAATIQPARFLGRLDSQGTVETGKIADLVLLEADPLADISNTKKIEAVVLGGKLLDKVAIQGQWKEAQEAASRCKRTMQDFMKPAEPERLALTGGTLIEVESGTEVKDGVVLIEGDRIKEVGCEGQVAMLPNTVRLDVRGKWIIPGLTDMHAHLGVYQYRLADLYLKFGITTVRDVGGDITPLRILREEIGSGKTGGPRLFFAGMILDGMPPVWPGSITLLADTPERAESIVNFLADQGVDAIKVYNLLTEPVLAKVIEVARRRGLPVIGHIPRAVTMTRAVEMGMEGLEHIRITAREILPPDEAAKLDYLPVGIREPKIWEKIDLNSAAIQKLIPYLAAKKIYLDPTLVVDEALEVDGMKTMRASPLNQLLPRDILAEMLKQPDVPIYNVSEELKKTAVASFQKRLKFIGMCSRAGVQLLAGTDSQGLGKLIPGVSLHRELELLCESGLTPLEALRASTQTAARALRHEGDLGAIKVGAFADLVILNSDPLVSISNTRKIHRVMKGGVIYEPAQLK
jgi:imidazolonepropionase-like amidohydrolase